MSIKIKQMLRDRALTDKERKNLAILEVIRKNGPISRTDISKITEFNIVTVSNYVNHYIRKGLVVEGDLDESTGGRKPVLVELNPKAGYIIGVGLNMLSMVGVLVDLETNVIYEIRKERPGVNNEEVVDRLAEMVQEIIEKSEVETEKLVGLGIGIPGIIDERGRTIRWPGMVGSRDISVCVSIKDAFEKRFGIPTFVENDANAAVLGEKWLGLDRDVKHMLYMFSGVGCGVLIDGEIYRGATGAAGELGIYNSREEGEVLQAKALHLGRWEMELGIVDKAKQLIAEGEKTVLTEIVEGGNIANMSIKDIIKGMKEKDEVAMKAIEAGGKNLGMKIAFLANLLNPEIVVIGGGIEDCGAILLESVKNTVKEWAVEEVASQVKIIPSAFGENSVALGVVGIVAREVFAQA